MVRALGLEPSLIRGKSPVPYQSGVTRRSGPGGNRTPGVGKTAGLQPAAPHGATDPFGDRCGDRSLDDASAVVKVLVSRLAVGRVLFGVPAGTSGSGGVKARSEERRVGKECRSRWSA